MSLSKKEKAELIKFGLALRKIREEKGWTLEDAEAHGWASWQHLQKIESGLKNINYTTILKLQSLYNVKILTI